jgi:hypothetical protein
MIMLYAAGKSLTSHFIAEALDATFILVAVPRLTWTKETIAVFAREVVARGFLHTGNRPKRRAPEGQTKTAL